MAITTGGDLAGQRGRGKGVMTGPSTRSGAPSADAGAERHSMSFCQRRYRAFIRPTVKVVTRIHLGLLRASRYRLGHRLLGGKIVLLTTVGRRSGRERTTPLAYMSHGESLVVAASCAGSDRPPDWWFNLQHQPEAVTESCGVKRAVRAHLAGSHAVGMLTPRFEQLFPQMRFYQRMATRQIPLVVLEPTSPAQAGRVGIHRVS